MIITIGRKPMLSLLGLLGPRTGLLDGGGVVKVALGSRDGSIPLPPLRLFWFLSGLPSKILADEVSSKWWRLLARNFVVSGFLIFW